MMKTQGKTQVARRDVLRGMAALGVAAPLGAALASCSSGGSGGTGASATQSADLDSSTNPFGLKAGTSIEAYVYQGGYGTQYVNRAVKDVQKHFKGIKAKVVPTTNIAQALQPRFVAGNPPDLVDNAGANQIPFASVLDQLEELDFMLDVKNYQGEKISDIIYPGVKEAGMYGGKFVAMNYVLTIYALWYSASLFDKEGWQPPKTWDDALDLGAKAKAKGKYLFVFGKESASYYQTLALNSAIKEGGKDLIDRLSNADPDVWSDSHLQDVFKVLEEMVKRGYFVPGGAGTQFTKAQAKWSNDELAIMYPSGSWIQNEMKDATKAGFEMTGAPEPTMTSSPKMTYAAVRSSAGEAFTIPTHAKNAAGGKEVLRAMLSRDTAEHFSKTTLAPTVVKGSVPSDAFGSSALKSVIAMIEGAGTNVFNYTFDQKYGLGSQELVAWDGFLSGQLDAKGLTKQLQDLLNKAAKSVK